MTVCETLLESSPSCLPALRMLARAATELGQIELAQTSFRACSVIDPEDDMAHIYRVRPSTAPLHTYLQLGPNWHQVEESHGKPFRWINGSEADLCVFSPAPHTGALTFQATGFGPTRHLQVWIGDKQVLTEPILADGVLRELRTAPVEWPSGAQRVRLVSEEASVSPQSLGQGDDSRQLSIGVSDVRLVGNP